MPAFCEVLESRMFLSVTPTQLADLQAIATAQLNLATAHTTRTSTLVADHAAIPAVRQTDQSVITSDLVQIRTDRGDRGLELADDGQLRADRAKLTLDVREANQALTSDNRSTEQQIVFDTRALAAARVQYRRDVRLNL